MLMVFVGTHDGRHAAGNDGICHIWRGKPTDQVVVVDLPKVANALEIDRAEVVLAVGIVVGREGLEARHQAKQGSLRVGVQGAYAGSEDGLAAKDQGCAGNGH